jgi:hypothetical protein
VRRYVRYHDLRHPDQFEHEEVNQFLTHLVVDRKSSGATQAQARAALMFLYKEVIRRPLGPVGDPDEIVRGKKSRKLPTVEAGRHVQPGGIDLSSARSFDVPDADNTALSDRDVGSDPRVP